MKSRNNRTAPNRIIRCFFGKNDEKAIGGFIAEQFYSDVVGVILLALLVVILRQVASIYIRFFAPVGHIVPSGHISREAHIARR